MEVLDKKGPRDVLNRMPAGKWVTIAELHLSPDGRKVRPFMQELVEAGLVEQREQLRPGSKRKGDNLYRRVVEGGGEAEVIATPDGSFVPPERHEGEGKAEYDRRVQNALDTFKRLPDPVEELEKLVRNLIHAYSSADGEEAGVKAAAELLARWRDGLGSH